MRPPQFINKNIYELIFANAQDADEFRTQNDSICYPIELDLNTLTTEEDVVGIKLRWYPYPSTLTAEIMVMILDSRLTLI